MGREWTKKELKFLRENPNMPIKQISAKLGRTEKSIEHKRSTEGIYNTQKFLTGEEKKTLIEIWGKPRKTIERKLPRFNWNQLCDKAATLGLPDPRPGVDELRLYTITRIAGYNSQTVAGWLAKGLKVTKVKHKGNKQHTNYIEPEDLWDFICKNPKALSIHRIPVGSLGVEPPSITTLRKTTPREEGLKQRRLTDEDRDILRAKYFLTDATAQECADRFGVSKTTVGRIVTKERARSGITERKKRVSKIRTESFLNRLDILYYKELKTQVECSKELECAACHITKGLEELRKRKGGK